jgi:hypothetical protein
VATLCNTRFNVNNFTFCPHSVFMCFVWISEKAAIFPYTALTTCFYNWDRQCSLLGTNHILDHNLGYFHFHSWTNVRVCVLRCLLQGQRTKIWKNDKRKLYVTCHLVYKQNNRTHVRATLGDFLSVSLSYAGLLARSQHASGIFCNQPSRHMFSLVFLCL